MVNLTVNSPIPTDIAAECRKCADIIDHFVKPEKGRAIDQLIPPHVLANAKGIAIITILKAGFLFSGRGGGGLVIARLSDGEWSAPSAIGSAGVGFGGQIGAEITDFVIILNTESAVNAFSSGGNVTLGGSLSVAAGPYGRTAEASGTANLAAIYSYSKSKGFFAGISIEGTVIIERKETNAAFYNKRISARDILSGKVPQPVAADVLYRALDRRIAAASNVTKNSTSSTNSYPRASDENQRPNSMSNAGGHSAPPPYSSLSVSPATTGSYLTKSSPGNSDRGASASTDTSSLTHPQSTTATSTGRRVPPPPPRPQQNVHAVAVYNFEGQCATDLSFCVGDVITVLKKTDNADSWWKGELNGKVGDFPGNYVKIQS